MMKLLMSKSGLILMGILHTQQKIREKRDREKTYLCYYDFSNKRFVQLATAEVKDSKVLEIMRSMRLELMIRSINKL